jgi:hypothetical protein
MASAGMINIPNLVIIGSEIQVVLRVIPHQFERL